MICGCRELEATYGHGTCKCVHYREKFPNCKCEEGSVSPYSPGRVTDDEALVRTIFNPEFVDCRGHLKPTYFQAVIPDFTVRGLSVNRKGQVTEADLRDRLRHHQGNRHDYLGFIAARCGDLRSLLSGDKRVFCVYDSATQLDASHADVCYSLSPDPDLTKRDSKRVRMKTARMLQAEFSCMVATTLSNAVLRFA